MILIGEVIDRASVPEVHVIDDPELLERVERAVDRREVDRGEAFLDARGQVVGGDVVLRGEEHRDDRVAGGGPPPPGGREPVDDPLDVLPYCSHSRLRAYRDRQTDTCQ